jgi:hypothetical protein
VDHPLAQPNKSTWEEYYEDSHLIEEIGKDVVRTHPDINFFIRSDTGSLFISFSLS